MSFEDKGGDPEADLDVIAAELAEEDEPADEPLDGPAAEGDDAPSTDEYEVIGDDRVRWADGTVADFAGNVIEDEPEPEPEVQRPAKPQAAQPVAQTTQPQAKGTPQIWTEEDVEKSVYTEAVEEELADLQGTDPLGYQRRSRELNREYTQKVTNLSRYAAGQFDTELASVAQRLPRAYEAYSADIQAAKAGLTLQQLQMPGMAEFVVKSVVFDKLGQDDLAFEEAVIRSLAGGKSGSGKPAVKAPVREVAAEPPTPKPPRAPNPAARLSQPGSANRGTTVRRPQQGSSGRDKLADHYMNMYPGMTYEEAKSYADTMKQQDALKAPLSGVTINGL